MSYGDVLGILFLHIGLILVAMCYWLFAEAMFPKMVEASSENYEKRPIVSLAVGLLGGVPMLIVGLPLIGGLPATKPLGFLIAGTPLMLGLLNGAGLCRRIGIGLPSPLDEPQPWRRVLRGGIVLALMCAFPLVGQFFVLPVVIVTGFGAFLLQVAGRIGGRRRRKDAVPAAAPEAEAGEAVAA